MVQNGMIYHDNKTDYSNCTDTTLYPFQIIDFLHNDDL